MYSGRMYQRVVEETDVETNSEGEAMLMLELSSISGPGKPAVYNSYRINWRMKVGSSRFQCAEEDTFQ